MGHKSGSSSVPEVPTSSARRSNRSTHPCHIRFQRVCPHTGGLLRFHRRFHVWGISPPAEGRQKGRAGGRLVLTRDRSVGLMLRQRKWKASWRCGEDETPRLSEKNQNESSEAALPTGHEAWIWVRDDGGGGTGSATCWVTGQLVSGRFSSEAVGTWKDRLKDARDEEGGEDEDGEEQPARSQHAPEHSTA